MRTKATVVAVPYELMYDDKELLEGGAQFCRFETLSDIKAYWATKRGEMRYACVGTGYTIPARFLQPHDWVFSPSKEALVSAVARWEEFKIAVRWYDAMSDEHSVGMQLQQSRKSRRTLRIALGTWSPQDEAAYVSNSGQGGRTVRKGFWRLANLPCALTHFDWFSEHASMPVDPELPKDRVAALLKRLTFDDWKEHQTLHDVHVMDAAGVDAEIAYWERERAEGHDPYEG
jgi:hypothetical protein